MRLLEEGLNGIEALRAILAFDPGGRVLWGNRAARELFGAAGAALEGEPVQRFIRLGFPAEGEPGVKGKGVL